MNVQNISKGFLTAYIIIALISCGKDPSLSDFAVATHTHNAPYKTRHVIVMVVDGVRYTETWGEPQHRYIPDLDQQLAPKGIILDNYWNNGGTYTTAGYTAFCTGYYQEINNGGGEHPYHPGIFQRYRKSSGIPDSLVWIVTSKDKLQVLSDCLDASWRSTFNPKDNCGQNGGGVGSGYRDDSLTYELALNVLKNDHPKLMLIGFKEPDPSGHSGNWDNYVKETKTTYRFCRKIWDFLQNDSVYSGSTTVFITNDHGRHSDGVSNGFISHGDGCEGCRHVLLYASGPDFKEGVVVKNSHEQLDVPVTIGALLGFDIPGSQGKVMWDLFK